MPTELPRAGLSRVLLATLTCLALLAGRMLYSGTGTFRFMVWNLGLAWIPYLLAAALPLLDGAGPLRRLGRGALLAGWLAFLPNAPYVLTDLVHIQARKPVPLWYDSVMLGMFGVTGLMLGVRALALVQGRVAAAWGAFAGWALAAVATGLCGIGIMIGRFERWNSWDIATRPSHLLADLRPLLNPVHEPRAWIASLLFGGCTFVLYLCLRPEQPVGSLLRSVGLQPTVEE